MDPPCTVPGSLGEHRKAWERLCAPPLGPSVAGALRMDSGHWVCDLLGCHLQGLLLLGHPPIT